VGIENNNENQKLIKEGWIREMVEVVPEIMLVEKIKRVREKNKKVVRVVEEVKKIGVRALKGDKWEIEGDLVLKEEKVYVPKDEELRLEDIPVAKHKSRYKITESVTRNYWWPGIMKNVGKYVE